MKSETATPSQEQLGTLAQQLIRAESTMTISTGLHNVPWAAPVYYANLGFALYFFSDPQSRHIQEAAASRRAAAAIFHPSSTWKDIRGIQMSGALEPLRTGIESLRAIRAYLKKFPFTRDFFSAAPKPDLEDFVKTFRVRLYRFQPDVLYYMDNGIRFGFRERISIPHASAVHQGDPF